MAQDANELVVASHGDVYVAPVGTTLPATNDVDASLNAAFVNLGLISEDGVSFSAAPDIQEFMAWQRQQPVRRERTGQALSMSFALEQWNVNNVPLAFGGGEVVETAAGVFKYTFPDDNDALDERSIVVDWQDGSKKFRLVFERGSVTEAVETNLVRSALATLPITFSVLASETGTSPGFFLAEDTSFSAVS